MFINLSNHPSNKWSQKQLAAATEYGDVIDMAFPNIDSEASETEIDCLVFQYWEKIQDVAQDCLIGDLAVHIMGEQTFCYRMIKLLNDNGVPCLASTTKRDVVENPDGTKTVKFEFCRFRIY